MFARALKHERVAVIAGRSPEGFWPHLRRLAAQPHWWAEVWAAAMLTAWASVNIGDGSALSPKYFGPLLHLAPECFWERAAFLVGLFQLASLARDNRWFRATSGFLASWLFGAVATGMLFSGYAPPGAVVFYIGNGLLNLAALYRNIRGSSGGYR